MIYLYAVLYNVKQVMVCIALIVHDCNLDGI